MKKIVVILTIALIAIKGIAQTIDTTVSGSAMDIKNAPVELASISLMKSKDSSTVKIAVSGKAGKFSFTGIPYGNYFPQLRMWQNLL